MQVIVLAHRDLLLFTSQQFTYRHQRIFKRRHTFKHQGSHISKRLFQIHHLTSHNFMTIKMCKCVYSFVYQTIHKFKDQFRNFCIVFLMKKICYNFFHNCIIVLFFAFIYYFIKVIFIKFLIESYQTNNVEVKRSKK